MLISTRGRYALRVLIDLAEHQTESYIPMKDVAARQELSLKYLERILPVLSQNGYVSGIHGKGGGYKLTKEPKDYTLGTILRLTEGSLSPVACFKEGAEPCEKSPVCRTLPVWKGLNDTINAYLDGITLEELLRNVETISDYCI